MMLERSGNAFGAGLLCERYIRGPEFSVDALSADGRARALLVCDRQFPAEYDLRDYLYKSHKQLGAIIGRTPAQIYDELEKLVSRALAGAGYSWGPSHTEFRYDVERDRWVLLEYAYRVGGGGGLGRLYEEMLGIPYNVVAIRAACQLPCADVVATMPSAVGKSGIWAVVPVPRRGRIKLLHGRDLPDRDPRVRCVTYYKAVGQRITPPPAGFEYLATCIAVADDTELDGLGRLMAREVGLEYA
jgi:biotin carboxylase